LDGLKSPVIRKMFFVISEEVGEKKKDY